jgi:hypothetical protein
MQSGVLVIQGDVNGDRFADFQVEVGGGVALLAADLVL